MIPTETDPTLTPTALGTYSVTVTNNFCVRTDSVTLTATSFNADLGADVTSCFVTPETLTATITVFTPGQVTFEWLQDGISIPGETNQTLQINQPGTYQVIVTAGECEATDTIEVIPGNDVAFDLGPAIESCYVTPVTLDATPTNYNVMDASFVWFLNGTQIAGETNPTLDATGPGLYEVIVMVGACENTDSVTLSNSNDIMIDLGENLTSCFLEPITLDATPSNYDVGNANFEWSLDGTIIPGEVNATLEAITAGLYEVTVTVGTCEAMDSITISPVNFTVTLGDDFETCFENTASITATISDFDTMDASFQWFLNGTEIVGETLEILPISEIGTYTVIATVGECTATDDVIVSEREDIEVAIAEEDFKTCPEETQILTALTDEENATFQWFKNGDSISGQTNATLEFTLTQEDSGIQNFSVVITVGDCVAEDAIDIQLYDVGNCVISQGISPNGDGFNDILDLEFLSDRAGGINDFKVFNRHGLLVYEQSDYIKEWFGQTDAGDELPTATYYVIMTFNSQDPVYGNQYAAWIYLNREAN